VPCTSYCVPAPRAAETDRSPAVPPDPVPGTGGVVAPVTSTPEHPPAPAKSAWAFGVLGPDKSDIKTLSTSTAATQHALGRRLQHRLRHRPARSFVHAGAGQPLQPLCSILRQLCRNLALETAAATGGGGAATAPPARRRRRRRRAWMERQKGRAEGESSRGQALVHGIDGACGGQAEEQPPGAGRCMGLLWQWPGTRTHTDCPHCQARARRTAAAPCSTAWQQQQHRNLQQAVARPLPSAKSSAARRRHAERPPTRWRIRSSISAAAAAAAAPTAFCVHAKALPAFSCLSDISK